MRQCAGALAYETVQEGVPGPTFGPCQPPFFAQRERRPDRFTGMVAAQRRLYLSLRLWGILRLQKRQNFLEASPRRFVSPGSVHEREPSGSRVEVQR